LFCGFVTDSINFDIIKKILQSLNIPYSNFCFFNFEKGFISTKTLDSAKEFLIQENFVFEKASADSDLTLLNFCKNNSTNIKSLLCLRSRVSQSIASCIQKIFKDNINTDLELNELALIVLNDDGRDFIRFNSKFRDGKRSSNRKQINWDLLTESKEEILKPFALEIIKTCDLKIGNLGTWAFQSVKGNRDFKKYLIQNKVFLNSKWSLIADSSQTRIKAALERYGNLNQNDLEYMLQLHNSYLGLYKNAKLEHKRKTGSQKGWVPDFNFLQSLDPIQTSWDNFDEIHNALTKYLQGTNYKTTFEENNYSKYDAEDSNFEEDKKIFNLIYKNLKESSLRIILEFLNTDKKKWVKDPDRKKAWQLYGENKSQREIAKICNHKQGWVSKLLQEKLISELIVDQTLKVLINLKEFSFLQNNIDELLSVKERLRNQLINSEQQKGNSYLRTWIKEAMQND